MAKLPVVSPSRGPLLMHQWTCEGGLRGAPHLPGVAGPPPLLSFNFVRKLLGLTFDEKGLRIQEQALIAVLQAPL